MRSPIISLDSADCLAGSFCDFSEGSAGEYARNGMRIGFRLVLFVLVIDVW